MAKKKVKKRIVKAKIQFLSLCPKGANNIQTIYKSEDGEDVNVELATIVKDGMSEQGEIQAVVYAPDIEDSQGHEASAEVIKDMAYDYAANGTGIDIRHDENKLSKEDIFVAESFIIQKDDPRFDGIKDYDGNEVDVTNGWGVVLKVNNEDLREQYRKGEWKGISMGGLGSLVNKENDEIPGWFTKWFKGIAITKNTDSSNQNSENDMKPEEIKKLVEDTVKTALETIKKTEDEAKGKDKKLGMGHDKPILKDKATAEDIAKYTKKMEIWELSELVNKDDLSSVRDFQILSKEIAEGKEVKKEEKEYDVFESFFKTNQDAGEIKGTKDGSDDPIGDDILKEYADIKKNK